MAERSFRYAPLSSGLDIVRKTLSQHEIAALQTTAIDQAAGTVNLTTVLAHASGEWIASDWPVCAVADTATPRRMGAALTYARRYALFTLVGIAGEDDLDAPDLDVPNPPDIRLQGPPSSSHGNGRLNGRAKHPEERAGGTAGPKTGSVLLKSMLEASASAALCEQMLAELKTIASADDAATWAHHKLGAKNSLTASDARRVEDAFEAKLVSLAENQPASRDTTSALTRPAAKAKRPSGSKAVDKSTLALQEPRRIRDKDHLRFVAQQSCLVCGRSPSDPHHLRFTQTPRSWPESQRRIHGSLVPRPPSRSAPQRRRGGLVANGRDRSDGRCACAVASSTSAPVNWRCSRFGYDDNDISHRGWPGRGRCSTSASDDQTNGQTYCKYGVA